MSHLRVKTTYQVEGAYGSRETKTLYAHINLSNDTTTFYDEDGNCIFSYEDTEKNNLFDAMQRLASPFKNDVRSRDLTEGVEHYFELPNEKTS